MIGSDSVDVNEPSNALTSCRPIEISTGNDGLSARESRSPSDSRPGSGSGLIRPNPGISSLITVSIGQVNAGCGDSMSASQVSSLASARVPGRSGYQLTASGASPAEAR
jgi:hypothetical protein